MKIGILTCSSVTQDLACSSFNCFKALRENEGAFARYNGDVQLAGIINCAGCGTMVAPHKLIHRVKSLTELNVKAIHLSTCMMNLCPFKDKYHKLLSETFPHIKFVKGTHGAPPGLSDENFRKSHQELVSSLVTQRKNMADVIPLIYHSNE